MGDSPGGPVVRDVVQLHEPDARRRPNDADEGAGGLHRRQGRGPVQAGHLPLLSARREPFLLEARRIKELLAHAEFKTDVGVFCFWGWQTAERASAGCAPGMLRGMYESRRARHF